MDALQEKIKEVVAHHGRERHNLLPVLQEVVEQERYLSDYAMTLIAEEMGISAADVYGTATFYSFMDTVPRGKYLIRVCKTITCYMKGKNQILMALEEALKIKLGETTPDKKFTLMETNCLGWCHKAPAMLINDDVHTELTVEKVHSIIKEYKERP
ncbi:MAG TPA: NADH-quinone oxidoreductase subunit NuoE [Tenuifilaceae bacterium]|jgi:NADH-quinone oxidoreductase E subunit|nr:NADH-quinone oxidoreductase subunit NuoE [Bacteroidales bacterium]MDI9515629.1 NADH-quinone oxidoreductase subunit NuoE [Bacteroidota bacterium]NLH57421.1 NADH-quinone oxidoreductase subunit NuoE [Rikenellaceae bacterium]OQC62327.1 MAG: NADH-quinone oxidoreductase subunit E [Bacteroidetes bacterium ADurb.Bin008]HNV81342.1 NADH-quinone oxidoreductase subunit NuoE [Tenuifilaceae bacterium]